VKIRSVKGMDCADAQRAGTVVGARIVSDAAHARQLRWGNYNRESFLECISATEV